MATEVLESESIEQLNKQAWDALYGQTDQLIWGNEPLQFVQQAFERISPFLPKQPLLLDAATGEGRNLPFLFQFSDRVIACDASRNALDKLNRSFPDVRTELCDLAATGFPAGSFDSVLACDVIETLPNLSEVLAEFHRIIKPRGFLVCNVPDMQDGIAGQNMEQIEHDEFMYQNRFFFRFQTKNEFIDFLIESGFRVCHDFSSTWTENAHPEYRQEAHSHTSRIFIAQNL